MRLLLLKSTFRLLNSKPSSLSTFKRSLSTSPPIAKEDGLPKAGVAAGVAVVAGGLYLFLQDPPVSKSGQSGGGEMSEEVIERETLKHWLKKKQLQKEIDNKHHLLQEAEIAKLVAAGGEGVRERRKECEARRAAIKEKEAKLVLDRHNESFPGMGGKTRSWAEQRRNQALLDADNDKKMMLLEEKFAKLDAAKVV